MRRAYCADLAGEGALLVLAASESHHMLRVVGVAPGERVELFDGEGGQVEAEFIEARDGLAVLRAVGLVLRATEPEVWLLMAQLKHGPFDTVLRMATELGVTHIVPVAAARSVAKGDRRDRWVRIVQGAARQCGRATVPELWKPCTLGEALALPRPEVTRWMAQPGLGSTSTLQAPCAVVLGPEGGWTPAELALGAEAGARPLGLGAHVLRADTAAAVALGRVASG